MGKLSLEEGEGAISLCMDHLGGWWLCGGSVEDSQRKGR